MSVSPPKAIYDFLKNATADPVSVTDDVYPSGVPIPNNEDGIIYQEVGTILSDADVHPTVYSLIKQPKTIRVGNAKFDLAPVGEVTKSFDVEITLQILAKVEDSEDAETYPAALDTVWALAAEAANQMNKDRSLGGQVCDLLVLESFQGWARIEGCIFAVVLLPVRINPTGKYA